MLLRQKFIITLLFLTTSQLSQADVALDHEDVEYTPGTGWQIPGTSVNIGGYANIVANTDSKNKSVIDLSESSLFFRWENGRLSFFSEIELQNSAQIKRKSGIPQDSDYIGIERLYVDYLATADLKLRYGKFLTPIGRWNEIHAAPLVWTTSRPLITKHTFPTNATGTMGYGSITPVNFELDYSIYKSIGEDWRPNPELDPFEDAYGFHLSHPTEGLGSIGFSYSNFQQRSDRGESKNLIGIDYTWSKNRYEVSFEGVYRYSDYGQSSDEKGFFIQGVAPISQNLYAISRYESFHQAFSKNTMNLWLAGLSYQITPAMILKLEYDQVSHNRLISILNEYAPEGLYTSLAILF